MASNKISKIKTGRGLAGSRIALVFAPPHAAPGSLICLTDFLNEQEGMRAIPGYHGPNENHVLRVSGLKDDTSFLRLLQEEFPKWQDEKEQAYGGAQRSMDAHFSQWRKEGNQPDTMTRCEIDTNVICEPLDEVDHFPHQTPFKRFVKENPNTLTGLAYMAGSLALLLAAWREPKRMPGHPRHDWFRAYSAGAYFSAAGILVALSQKSDNPRDVYTIMESVYPPLSKMSREERNQAESQTNDIAQFLRNHPWEISMLLNSSGAAAHAVSTYKRGRHVEMAAALATLTACGLSAVIPEKGGRSMLPIGQWLEDKDGKDVLQQMEEFAQNHPNVSGWVHRTMQAMDWVQENPLKLASGVSGLANVGYIAASVQQKNPALGAMSAAFLTGNYTQSQATKGRGDGFDSVVTAAADIVASDPDLKDASPVEVKQRIHRLAHRLTNQREIVHPERRLIRGIEARMQRNTETGGQQRAGLQGFLPSEKHILKNSPFAQPQHVQQILNEPKDSQPQMGV